jgi:tetratricopeptide (TPR) repeat protein
MKRRSGVFLLSLFLTLFAGSQNLAAQEHKSRLEQGLNLYRAGYWADAAMELRRSWMAAANAGQAAESLYWLSLAEFFLGDYPAALREIDELQKIAPAGLRIDNILYYKGRSLFYVNRPEEALTVFRLYAALLNRSRMNSPRIVAQRATLSYWIGECLYVLGRHEQAAEFFTVAINAKPKIEQYEAASYRLAIIQQNKLQEEILDWSYSEYQRLAEEYQEQEADFKATIEALQQQTRTALIEAVPVETVPIETAPVETTDVASIVELDARIREYQRILDDAAERIRLLETGLSETEQAAMNLSASPPLLSGQEQDAVRRIRALKAEAEQLRNALMSQP